MLFAALGAALITLFPSSLASATTVTQVASQDLIGDVNEVHTARDGSVVVAGGMRGDAYSIWSIGAAGQEPRKLADSTVDETSGFGLTPDGRYALLGSRLVDVGGGTSRRVAAGPGRTQSGALATDGSVLIAKRHSLRRFWPDGRLTTLIQGLPASEWAGSDHGLAWCGQRRPARPPQSAGGPLYLGTVDLVRSRLVLRSSRLVPTNGWRGCVVSDDGTAVATIVSLQTRVRYRYRSVLVGVSRSGRVRRFSVPKSLTTTMLSPDGRYVLAGDIDINRGECPNTGVGGFLVFDLARGTRRKVALTGASTRRGRRCAEAPDWSPSGDSFTVTVGGRLHLVDPATGTHRALPAPQTGCLNYALGFRPDERRLIAWCNGDWSGLDLEQPDASPTSLSTDSFRPVGRPGSPTEQRGLWFGADRAFMTDAVGRLWSAPLEGFGESGLVAAEG